MAGSSDEELMHSLIREGTTPHIEDIGEGEDDGSQYLNLAGDGGDEGHDEANDDHGERNEAEVNIKTHILY